jgi:hypothetical protein
MTPAERFERRLRRAARKRTKRLRAQQAREARVIAWLGDRPERSSRAWEMQLYGFEIPISEQVADRLRRHGRRV